MAVQPLNRRKIVKKRTNKQKRFQSDEYVKVKVSITPPSAGCGCSSVSLAA